jgi:lipoprotein
MTAMKFRTLALLLFVLFTLSACQKREVCKGRRKHHFIEKYFIPTEECTTASVGKDGDLVDCFLSMSYNSCIEDEESSEFKELAELYGDVSERELLLFAPPRCKPYNIQGIRVLQKHEGTWIDVSEKAEISYDDYSTYIQNGYQGATDERVYRKMSELTEHDLKWLSRDLRVRIRQLTDARNLVLEFTIKDGNSFRKKLTNGSGFAVK